MIKIAYKTDLGVCYNGKIEDALQSKKFDKYRGQINLIVTSPPFPLNRKKKYGNFQGDEYINWIKSLSKDFGNLLTPDGSIVIEVGNSWEPGIPVMSTLALKSLLAFLEEGGYYLCQQFIWNNTAKLPTPAQWVNIERTRVKDSFTYIWWMSKTPNPKANNKNVLVEYSSSMKKLLKNGSYNSGFRPSEHSIGEKSFLSDNKGAIPSNVISSANTQSGTPYQLYCKNHNLQPHPARMPESLVEFFIKFLTNENDLILDPFGGSNTTGSVAEKLNRNWASIEPTLEYIHGSLGRFNKIQKVADFLKMSDNMEL
ncbi:MAG: site-specific DNA-methyltransferase [Reichenbachiella sp.]|uniref:DNA-methyltransferase n=1 Tax=Reichenbachiella sp. TaxID=2184521 RepID=UPI002965FFF2|nr:site-specific DNA-methyltransferase [Reichenbachiella sp.]MDW3208917.1 site-specific DNA-methyltransferase [Reichenbachiella sp.]